MATWLVLLGLVLKRPWILLRPSVWVTLLLTVHLGGAAAFVSDDYAYFGAPSISNLANLEQLRLSTLLLPIAVFIVVLLTPAISSRTRTIYRKCRASISEAGRRQHRRETRLTLVMSMLGGVLLGGYLAKVPIQTTGLWANIFDPANSDLARELSLNLQTSPFVRYGFSWYESTVAPACAGLLWLTNRNRGTHLRHAAVALCVVGIIVSVMLTGARSPGGSVIIKLGMMYVLMHGFRRGGKILVGSASCALVLASLLSILRENMFSEMSWSLVWYFLYYGIFGRMFLSPFSTGVYTNLYAQDSGLLGFSNIRPLATLLGVEHINLAQAVGMRYVAGATESIGMNTCFLYDFQASFGLFVGFWVALAAVILLDLLVFCFRRIDGAAIVTFYAVLLGSMISLSSTAYFVSLNSSGILWIAILAWLVGSRYYRRDKKCVE